MQGLLANIELDIQELKCLVGAFSQEPNAILRGVLKRNILQLHKRLDLLSQQLDVAKSTPAISSAGKEEKEIIPVSDPANASASTPILAERINTTADFRSSISLNDSFRFSRELFEGDTEKMNRVLHQIGEMSSYTAALSFLKVKVDVDEENEAMVDLLELLKKHFN